MAGIRVRSSTATLADHPRLTSDYPGMKHPILHHLLLGALLACADAALAERYPLSSSCEREVTFERAPSRAVSHDINLTEMMVALGLQTRMVGYTGIMAGGRMPIPD